MSEFLNKNIIVGVTGGIAAYKAAELVRLLIKQGAQVQVVMTRSAEQFVSPLTFQALSGNSVRTELFDVDAEAGMGHIELARWADLIIVAPASANTMAKIAYGMADNLLTTLCLASPAPIVIAPAMNQQMWHHQVTANNVHRLLEQENLSLCGPVAGEQACGDIGLGRMAEPEAIIQHACQSLQAGQLLAGKRVLLTAGPTIEDIDPVRYISNRSSGKMGYAIARAAQRAGAEVTLITGPVALSAPEKIQLHAVRNALQMHEAVMTHVRETDIFIATAAVADYRPVHKENSKIKKDKPQLNIALTKNPDILAEVAALTDKPFCVGFAAETNDLEKYALDKLKRKKLDLIVANQVGESLGFEQDSNELHLFWPMKDGVSATSNIHSKTLHRASKSVLARQLINEIAELINKEDSR